MFNQGQKVVCINDQFPMWVHRLFTDLLKEGITYTVREVFVGRKNWGGGEGEVGVLLVELHNPPDPRHKEKQELGFDANRFAPLQTMDEQLVEEVPEETVVMGALPSAPVADLHGGFRQTITR